MNTNNQEGRVSDKDQIIDSLPKDKRGMSSLPPASTRDVAIAEIKLLRRGLPGMRTVLPRSHALFAGTNYSITHGASLPSIVEMGEWEKESEICISWRTLRASCLAEISSGVFHDVAAFATHWRLWGTALLALDLLEPRRPERPPRGSLIS